MKILFLTLVHFNSLNEKGIYTDLLREFVKNGHNVCAISPIEKRYGKKTEFIEDKNYRILNLRIGNIQKTNIIEKGISTILLSLKYKKAIRRYFSNIRFDLVLYSTPPITLLSAVEYVKKRDNAKTYLLLKDIFPQNAIDIGLLKKSGLKGLLYRYFRNKEKKLYSISDRIGCMSQANVDYLLKHNKEIESTKVEVCPNSIDVVDNSISDLEKERIRKQYKLPLDKKIFIYGGNLGKPQGISFMIDCLKECKDLTDAFFLIVGSGTEYDKIEKYMLDSKQPNVKLMKFIAKDDYNTLLGACDCGLIFLDYRFTIPNFPSRLLYYMQAKLPVFAITDPNTDIGKIIYDGYFGWWVASNDSSKFKHKIIEIMDADLTNKGQNAWEYLIKYYHSRVSYDIIYNHYKEWSKNE